MNITQLRYLKKIAETENITQAANELYISQPALSKAIKQLELELGFELTKKAGRGIKITESLQQFYPYLDNVLQQLDAGIEKVQAFEKGFEYTVNLHLEVGSLLIPNLVDLFQKNLPNIQLLITQHSKCENADFHYLFSAEKKEQMINLPLITEDISIAIPKDHPLSKNNILNLRDLLPYNLLMLTKENSLRRTIDQYAEKNKVSFKIAHTTDEPATLRGLIHNNSGLSFFPTVLWKDDLAKQLTLKNIADYPLSRTIYLSAPASRNNTLNNILEKEIRLYLTNLKNN